MATVLCMIIRNGLGETIAELSLESQQENKLGKPDLRAREYPNESRITDAQRRMLFRLAARLGFEGDHARSYVDRRLGTDPDRRTASRLIGDMLDEAKRSNGGHDAGAA